MGVGLKLEAWFNAEKDGYLIPRTPVHKWDLGGLLHPSWTVDNRCFDLRRLFLPGSHSEPGQAPREPPDTGNKEPSQSGGTQVPDAGTSSAPGSEPSKNPVFRIDPSVPIRIQPFGSEVSKSPAVKKAG